MVIQGPKKAVELILEIDKSIDSDNYDSERTEEDNEKTFSKFKTEIDKLDKNEILALAGSMQAIINISKVMFDCIITEIDNRYQINSLYEKTP